MSETLGPKGFQILSFIKKFFFQFSHKAKGPQKIFDVQLFKNFEKMSEIAIQGLGEYQKEQSHEFWQP